MFTQKRKLNWNLFFGMSLLLFSACRSRQFSEEKGWFQKKESSQEPFAILKNGTLLEQQTENFVETIAKPLPLQNTVFSYFSSAKISFKAGASTGELFRRAVSSALVPVWSLQSVFPAQNFVGKDTSQNSALLANMNATMTNLGFGREPYLSQLKETGFETDGSPYNFNTQLQFAVRHLNGTVPVLVSRDLGTGLKLPSTADTSDFVTPLAFYDYLDNAIEMRKVVQATNSGKRFEFSVALKDTVLKDWQKKLQDSLPNGTLSSLVGIVTSQGRLLVGPSRYKKFNTSTVDVANPTVLLKADCVLRIRTENACGNLADETFAAWIELQIDSTSGEILSLKDNKKYLQGSTDKSESWKKIVQLVAMAHMIAIQ